ncbi:hypothetical protein PybrP1_005955 [[Pythium] brassicae (nom. inval.)]|nr:hypothetical protein PybrP1_005955 [[Pythium] brassicae (nom. inval.)]
MLFLLLALVLGSALANDYEILSVVEEDNSGVVVVRRSSVLYLLYDETIIGAEFDHPELRLQAAYPGFAIMQAAAYLDRPLARAAQIGLGIGTAGDPEECANGETFVTDGLAFLSQKARPPAAGDGYDLFLIDVYTGWNPVAFYAQEEIQRVRDQWLRSPAGVLVVNFVGLFKGPHAVVPKSIFRTLQSVFVHVKCFREMDNLGDDDGSNIVFFASNEPFAFSVPTDGSYHNPDYNTYFYIVSNFPKWEIFTDLKQDASVEIEVQQAVGADEVTFSASAATPPDESLASPSAAATSANARVLTRASHGQDEFQDTHAFTQAHMRARVVEQFPPAFWADVKEALAAKQRKKSPPAPQE